jgi:Tfp pilus assembly protein PilN
MVAIGVTLAHTLTLAHLLSSGLRQTEGEVYQLENELAQMRADRERIRALKPDKDDLDQWNVVRGLVDRRVFRWTTLFARLAAVVPADIKLSAIEPVMEANGAEVRLTATAPAGASVALLKLVQRLEAEPDFDNVAPEAMGDDESGNEIRLRLRYRPTSKPPVPSTAPGTTASPVPASQRAQP